MCRVKEELEAATASEVHWLIRGKHVKGICIQRNAEAASESTPNFWWKFASECLAETNDNGINIASRISAAFLAHSSFAERCQLPKLLQRARSQAMHKALSAKLQKQDDLTEETLGHL
mgnify:CR=1 FL=1